MIWEKKAEGAVTKRLAAEGRWEEAMTLAGQKKARGTRGFEEKTTTL